MSHTVERVRRRSGLLSTESAGETILVNASAGRFYGLAETGSLIWARLARPATLGELMEALAGQCTALPGSATSEVAAFLGELQREELVEPAPAGGEEAAPEAAGKAKQAYGPPRLDRGTLRQAAWGATGGPDGGWTPSLATGLSQAGR